MTSQFEASHYATSVLAEVLFREVKEEGHLTPT